jgi:hypothetical protein
MTKDQRTAVLCLADSEGWNNRTVHEVGLLLWAIFRYYAIRLAGEVPK